MILLPAIDLVGGKVVRLLRGDYAQMTVYDDDPLNAVRAFEDSGAKWLHLVDLEGARDGNSANLEAIRRIVDSTSLSVEMGGGIRDMEAIERALSLGVRRAIIGTAAVTDPGFVEEAVSRFGDAIAVGADARDWRIAIRGWREESAWTLMDFAQRMQQIGVRTLICTDIARDGAMRGSNLEMYASLVRETRMNIIASGGVSSMEDVRALAALGVHGAIIGKAYYTGAIDLKEAIEAVQ